MLIHARKQLLHLIEQCILLKLKQTISFTIKVAVMSNGQNTVITGGNPLNLNKEISHNVKMYYISEKSWDSFSSKIKQLYREQGYSTVHTLIKYWINPHWSIHNFKTFLFQHIKFQWDGKNFQSLLPTCNHDCAFHSPQLWQYHSYCTPLLFPNHNHLSLFYTNTSIYGIPKFIFSS